MPVFHTTIGQGLMPVAVHYEVEQHEADRYDNTTGRDYSVTVIDIEITAVMGAEGFDVSGYITPEVAKSLEADCKAHELMRPTKERAARHYSLMAEMACWGVA